MSITLALGLDSLGMQVDVHLNKDIHIISYSIRSYDIPDKIQKQVIWFKAFASGVLCKHIFIQMLYSHIG